MSPLTDKQNNIAGSSPDTPCSDEPNMPHSSWTIGRVGVGPARSTEVNCQADALQHCKVAWSCTSLKLLLVLGNGN